MMDAEETTRELEENENEVEEEEVGEEQEDDEEDEEVAEQGAEDEDEAEPEDGAAQESKELEPVKQKRTRKEQTTLKREPGKSLLPFSRVQKIIKADKDIPVVAKEATFLVSLATEVFIAELAQAAQRTAEREKRATVQHKDIATVVRKADEFMFLEDLIPWLSPEPEKKRGKPTTTSVGLKPSGPTLLDQFVVQNKEKKGEEEGMDVVMNEDGTMYAVGDTNDELS